MSDDPGALALSGKTHLAAGRLDEAAADFEALFQKGFADPEALRALIAQLADKGAYAAGLHWAERFFRAAPEDVFGPTAASFFLLQLDQPERAAQAAALAIDRPDPSADAANNLCIALERLGDPASAIEAGRLAVALAPADPDARLNLANALKSAHEPEAARAETLKALALAPGLARAHYNLGNILQDLKDPGAALAAYGRALEIEPENSGVRWNRALLLLQLGRFEEGFAEYEWRWRDAAARPQVREFVQPLWLGETPLGGRTLLVHCEQGLGDSLQFARFLNTLRAEEGRVLFETFAALKPLFTGQVAADGVFGPGEVSQDYDLQIPLMSLPLALMRRGLWRGVESPPYLVAPSEARARRREAAASTGPLRIGLCLAGSSTHRNDRFRSLPPGLFLERLPRGPDYVLVQAEIREDLDAALRARPDIRRLSGELASFAETAALIETLDRVVTVDTSVAHLCGAMGASTDVLLPANPDWRWGLESDRTPFYPSVRLWRQERLGDWGPVFDALFASFDAVRPY